MFVCCVNCSENISFSLFAVSPVQKHQFQFVCCVTCCENISFCLCAVSPILKTSVSVCVLCHLFWKHQFLFVGCVTCSENISICLCAVWPVLKTSVSAAVSYSDIIVSILMDISSQNVIFCANVSCLSVSQHVLATDNCSHFILSVLYMYTRIFSCSLLLSEC